MCKRNLKKLALNLSLSSSYNNIVTQKTSMNSNDMSNNNSNTNDVYMQQTTSNIYQQGPACILPNLYLGACYNALNVTQLTRHGITCIINVANEIKINVPLPHIEYHHIKWTHSQLDLAASEFDRVIETIRIAHDRNQNVLIHCQQGIERSAALILAFLMKSTRYMNKINAKMNVTFSTLAGQHWSLDRALSFVKEKAPNIRPNMELLYQLREYEQLISNQQLVVEKRYSIQNRTRRSESVTCSEPSTRNTLLTTSSSFQSLNKVMCHQRPRSASFRDSSSSANLAFSTTTNTITYKSIDKQHLAITALIIVLIAMYQRKYCSDIYQHKYITTNTNTNTNNNDNEIDTIDTNIANNNINSNRHLNSQFLKPVFPVS
jgi:protein-tyrosine phosphatase